MRTVPNIPQEAVDAAVAAYARDAYLDGQPIDGDERVIRAALEAAAPLLADTIAQKILAHMEEFGPRPPAGTLEPVTTPGRAYRTWRRHFGIAARVAAGAFYTREDELRKAAEAIGRGDYAACRMPEDEDHGRQ